MFTFTEAKYSHLDITALKSGFHNCIKSMQCNVLFDIRCTDRKQRGTFIFSYSFLLRKKNSEKVNIYDLDLNTIKHILLFFRFFVNYNIKDQLELKAIFQNKLKQKTWTHSMATRANIQKLTCDTLYFSIIFKQIKG